MSTSSDDADDDGDILSFIPPLVLLENVSNCCLFSTANNNIDGRDVVNGDTIFFGKRGGGLEVSSLLCVQCGVVELSSIL